MIQIEDFEYQPGQHEKEKASNSYLVSFVAIIAGYPLPIINLIATIFFYYANKKGTYFVRWHCTQALISQIILFFFNSIGFWWTVSIIFNPSKPFSTEYIFYIVFIVLINLIELIHTIYSAIKVGKGIHVKWYYIGNLTDKYCKKNI